MEAILAAWGRILTGRTPAMSIEITRECPLHCTWLLRLRRRSPWRRDYPPRGGATSKAMALIDGVLALVDRDRPLHLSIVGGEPLVRFRELDTLLPMLAERGGIIRSSSRARSARFRSTGTDCAASQSSSRSTACSPSTTPGARQPPTIGSSSTSKVIASPFIAR